MLSIWPFYCLLVNAKSRSSLAVPFYPWNLILSPFSVLFDSGSYQQNWVITALYRRRNAGGALSRPVITSWTCMRYKVCAIMRMKVKPDNQVRWPTVTAHANGGFIVTYTWILWRYLALPCLSLSSDLDPRVDHTCAIEIRLLPLSILSASTKPLQGLCISICYWSTTVLSLSSVFLGNVLCILSF